MYTQLLMLIALFPVLVYGQDRKPLSKGDCLQPEPFHDYRHCDFNGRDLSTVNLEGSLLSGVNFQNARMPDCNLMGAKLNDADLKWAMLSGCRASSADFTGADLFHT
ncbi:MAG: pentapeptide repeat-containing protein, partial [Candidatus Thiodiazotropha sp.]